MLQNITGALTALGGITTGGQQQSADRMTATEIQLGMTLAREQTDKILELWNQQIILQMLRGTFHSQSMPIWHDFSLGADGE